MRFSIELERVNVGLPKANAAGSGEGGGVQSRYVLAANPSKIKKTEMPLIDYYNVSTI